VSVDGCSMSTLTADARGEVNDLRSVNEATPPIS
jgi:hypothetical protein